MELTSDDPKGRNRQVGPYNETMTLILSIAFDVSVEADLGVLSRLSLVISNILDAFETLSVNRHSWHCLKYRRGKKR